MNSVDNLPPSKSAVLAKKTFHPLLICIFPILFLYKENITVLSLVHLLPVLVFSECIVIAAWFVLSLFMKSGRSSGVVVSLFILWFVLYSSASEITYNFLRDFLNVHLKQRFFLIFWIVLLPALLVFFAGKKRRGNKNLTTFLNVTSLLLVLVSLTQACWLTASKP